MLLYKYPDKRSSRHLGNVGNHLPDCTVAYLRRSQSRKLFDLFQRDIYAKSYMTEVSEGKDFI